MQDNTVQNTTLKGLDINGLTSELPIIQGGMGVGVSLSRLSSAVAREGGIGIISAAHPGFNREGFDDRPLKTNLEGLAYHIKEAKAHAAGGVVGVNIMCASANYDQYVRCCVDNGADLIISGAGLPITLPEIVGDAPIKIAPIVSPVKAVKVLLKLWDRRYGRTADMIVIEGPKAGGHLGFSMEELADTDHFDDQIKDIIAHVRQYEEKYNRSIPVVFGGGVFDRADIDHYIGLGCAGVQMATRFVATEECDVHDNFKSAYLAAQKEDVAIVKSPVGMPGRALNNKFIRSVANHRKPVTKCFGCMDHCDPATTPYCITAALTNSARGNVDEGLVFAGENAYRVNEMTTVKKLISALRTPALVPALGNR